MVYITMKYISGVVGRGFDGELVYIINTIPTGVVDRDFDGYNRGMALHGILLLLVL